MKALRSRRVGGFTLIEIMVVITILGILAALIVPRVVGRTDDARIAAARQDIASVMQALKLYRLDNGRYPTTEQGLAGADHETDDRAGAEQLETGRLSRAQQRAEGSVGPSISVSESGPARRDRRLQLRCGRPVGRQNTDADIGSWQL